MKRFLMYIVCCTLTLACATTREHVDASVVRITYGTSGQVCTGFVVAQNTVLTASHCVDVSPSFDGKPAMLIGQDEYFDLAVYTTETGSKPVLRLRESPVTIDELILATGYAMGWAQPITTHNTVLLIVQKGPPMHARGIIYQGLFVGGMSGGPVTDRIGRVVGIVQQTRSGINYGVDVTIIRAFLEDMGVR